MGLLPMLDVLKGRLYGTGGEAGGEAGGGSADTPQDSPQGDGRALETSEEVVVLLLPDRPDSVGNEDDQYRPDTKIRGGTGETARALDALLILEAIAQAPVRATSGVRLGSLILASGLPANEVFEILEDLDRDGLVDGGNRFRCFRLAPRGREALAALEIEVDQLVEYTGPEASPGASPEDSPKATRNTSSGNTSSGSAS